MVGIDIDGLLVQRARQVLADEIRAAADVAKREAEGYQRLSGTEDGGVESQSWSKVIGAVKFSRPLMPRSLRAAPPPTIENQARTTLKGETNEEQATLSSGQKQPEAPTSSSPRSKQPGITENIVARAPREREEERKMACNAEESGMSPRVVEKPSVKAQAKNGRKAKPDAKPAGPVTLLRRMPSGDQESHESDGCEVPQATPKGQEGRNGHIEGPVDDPTPTFLAGCSVSFERKDFTTDPHGDHGYDVVSLFSVVKWMHINGGDDAVGRVFRKAHALLRPGSRLILERQPWKSYKKSARQHGSAKAQEHANTYAYGPRTSPLCSLARWVSALGGRSAHPKKLWWDSQTEASMCLSSEYLSGDSGVHSRILHL